MPGVTTVEPNVRVPRSLLLGQARQVSANPTLVAMLDTAPGPVALLNPSRQIVFCNQACVETGGLTGREEALGLRPGDLLRCIHAAGAPDGCGTSDSCRHCGMAQALVLGERGRPNSGECLLQCHTETGGPDQYAEYAVTATPLPHLGDGWQCYSLRDISGEKRRDALERTFFHDIMNHAGAVEGVSAILATGDLPREEHAEFVRMLSASASGLVDEIRSHRTLLAAERGDLAADFMQVDALEALRNAAATGASLALERDQRVSIAAESQSVRFLTDPALLGRILLNLLKNALEASEHGAGVAAACTLAEPERVRFSVSNSAVMPEHVRAHVFQRSFTTKGAGRGLGTYSVRLLTERYLGGRAWFESGTATGTTFHVEFPV